MSRSLYSRSSTCLALVIAIGAAPLALACDKSGSDAQAEANQAQEKANAEVANANQQVTTTAAKAQAKADESIAAAQSDFAKTREDYRHDVQSKLDSLDKQLSDLDAKAKKSTTTAKADLKATLPAPPALQRRRVLHRLPVAPDRVERQHVGCDEGAPRQGMDRPEDGRRQGGLTGPTEKAD